MLEEHLTSELNATKKEIDRLVKNRLVFYEVMSDMVFIFDKNYRIQDMNNIARNLFGDLRDSICYEVLYQRDKPCTKKITGNIIHVLDTIVLIKYKNHVGHYFIEHKPVFNQTVNFFLGGVEFRC